MDILSGRVSSPTEPRQNLAHAANCLLITYACLCMALCAVRGLSYR